MRSSNSRGRKHGFTLKEILCVVALFSFFAAIIVPTDLATSRRCAEKSGCQSNLQKLVLATKQYMNDNDYYYPLVFGGGNRPQGWASALLPYIRDTKVFQCPSDTNPLTESPTANGYNDYWYNANFMCRLERSGKIIFKSVSDHGPTSQSQNIIFGDGGNSDGSGGHNATYNVCGDGSSLNRRNQICRPAKLLAAIYPAAQIHLGGANIAFADGHVKWIKGVNTSQGAQVTSNAATPDTIGLTYTFSLLPWR